MALLGSGILAVWNDVVPADEAEYDDWYLRDHFPDRLGVPGFRRGRRYEALAGAPRYFTFYETATVAVLGSAAYLARLDRPTDWTRRVMPSFRNMVRTPCRLVASFGRGEGGIALAIRLAPQDGEADRLRTALRDEILPALCGRPGIVGAHLWEADPVGPSAATREIELRGAPDATIAGAIVVEATRGAALEAVRDGPLSPRRLAARGAAPDPAVGLYRLLYSLSANL